MKVSGIPFVQGRNYSSDADGKKYAIAIHNTANDASAEAEASYATRRTDNVSSHFYCDSNSMVQSLDTTVKAWHAGSAQGNDNSIAVEITGVNSWTRTQWLNSVAWDILGKALAQVCKYYGIPLVKPSVATMKNNPRVKGFYGHNDMRQAWGGTTHTDPGPNFPWDKLFSSVSKYLTPEVPNVVTTSDSTRIQYMDGRIEAMTFGREKVREGFAGAGTEVWIVELLRSMSSQIADLQAKVTELVNRNPA